MKDLFERLGFNGIQIEENYINVFETPKNRSSAIGATFKLVYHMLINGEIRRKVKMLLDMGKTVSLKSEGEYENVGYLIFTAEKMY